MADRKMLARAKTIGDVFAPTRASLGGTVEEKKSEKEEIADDEVMLARLKGSVIKRVQRVLAKSDTLRTQLLDALQEVWNNEFEHLVTSNHRRILRQRAEERTMASMRKNMEKVLSKDDENLTESSLWMLQQFYGGSAKSPAMLDEVVQHTSAGSKHFMDRPSSMSRGFSASSFSGAMPLEIDSGSELGSPATQRRQVTFSSSAIPRLSSYNSAYMQAEIEPSFSMEKRKTLIHLDSELSDALTSMKKVMGLKVRASLLPTGSKLSQFEGLEMKEDPDGSMHELTDLDTSSYFSSADSLIKEISISTFISEPVARDEENDIERADTSPSLGLEVTKEHRDKLNQVVVRGTMPPTISHTGALDFLQECGTDWNFSPFKIQDFPTEIPKGEYLSFCGMKCLEMFGLLDYGFFAPSLMVNFFRRVESVYKDIPYHNVFHSIDVMSSMCWLMKKSRFFQVHGTPLDYLCAIIATCAHDLGHDGYDNSYHIATRSEQATMYNDICVLENYHVSQLFLILKRHDECNWFATLTWAQQKYARSRIISMILATEFNKHGVMLKQLNGFIDDVSESLEKEDLEALMSQSLVMKSLSSPSQSSASLEMPPASVAPKLSTIYSESAVKRKVVGSPVTRAKDSIDDPPTLSISDIGIPEYVCMNGLRLDTRGAKNMTGIVEALLMGGGMGKTLPSLFESVQPIVFVDGDSEDTRIEDCFDEKGYFFDLCCHLCDISNPTKDLEKCYGEWTRRVCEEFFRQGDAEKRYGLPLTPLYDRTKSTVENIQIGFIKFVVRGTYENVSQVIGELKPLLDTIDVNLQHWNTEKERKTAAPSPAMKATVMGTSSSAPVGSTASSPSSPSSSLLSPKSISKSSVPLTPSPTSKSTDKSLK